MGGSGTGKALGKAALPSSLSLPRLLVSRTHPRAFSGLGEAT